MANVEKISISLPHDLVEYIKESVVSGSYSTASEFVRDSLRERRRREVEQRYRERIVPKNKAHLKQMIQEGIDSLERGEGIPAEEAFARLQKRFGKMGTSVARAKKPRR
jgi:putative addiction module CopG family antidote